MGIYLLPHSNCINKMRETIPVNNFDVSELEIQILIHRVHFAC